MNKTEVLSQTTGQTKVEVMIGDDLKTLTETVVYIRYVKVGLHRGVSLYNQNGIISFAFKYYSIQE